MRVLRLFAKITFLFINLSIGNSALLEVWRQRTYVRGKQSVAFICEHIVDSVLQMNESRLKKKARMFSVNFSILWQNCNRKMDKLTMDGQVRLDLTGNQKSRAKKEIRWTSKIKFSFVRMFSQPGYVQGLARASNWVSI